MTEDIRIPDTPAAHPNDTIHAIAAIHHTGKRLGATHDEIHQIVLALTHPPRKEQILNDGRKKH